MVSMLDDAAEHPCPFWLEVDPKFAGSHGVGAGFVLLTESRGGGELMLQGDRYGFGGGGGGRLLPAWRVDDTVTIGFGVEIGGGGVIETADREQTVLGAFAAAAPILLRFADVTTLYDIEIAAVVRFTLISTHLIWPMLHI